MDAVLHALVVCVAVSSPAATIQTPNFVIHAQDPALAQQVAEAAEHYRRELSIEWTGREMPRWSSPCPVYVKEGPELGAGGATTFSFEHGEVFGWRMNVEGPAERILDSVLPHEINHTIFACYFRRPLPRWADEGAASLIEHESERLRLKRIHEQALKQQRRIPLQKLLSMKDYPQDRQQVLTLYAEGYSLADYLIQQSDKPTYLKFLNTAHRDGWETAFQKHYGYEEIATVERDLNRWLVAGSPALSSPAGIQLAGARVPRQEQAVVRGQSPDMIVAELGPAAPFPKRTKPVAVTAAAPRSRESLQAPLASETMVTLRSRTQLVRPAYSVNLDRE